MTVWRSIRPLDVLYLRGNKLFDGAGDHSEPLMPPWPSLFAGAIRSRMLVDAGVDLGRFTDETVTPPAELADVLGTPAEPGSFRIAAVAVLAQRGDGRPSQPVVPLPADVVVTRAEDTGAGKTGTVKELEVTRLETMPVPAGSATSAATPRLLALRRSAPAKPESGYWLTLQGFASWLEGETPGPEDLVHRSDLWKTDPRLGIAMDRASGTSADGKLYTSEIVAMAEGVGFLVGIDGAAEEQIPGEGLLRLGGDGRGAEIAPTGEPQPWPAGAPPKDRPFTLYLETPGLFPNGWLPPGVDPDTLRLEAGGVTARLAAAAVPRFEVISGWNVAAHAPKPAQRAVPAGSVYYFDEVTGDPAAYVHNLWKIVERELGDRFDTVWRQRRAEGFNAAFAGTWPGGAP